jgi:hypothetical protein
MEHVPDGHTKRNWIEHRVKRLLRLDPLLLLFLGVGWCLIFGVATLGLQRDQLQWIPVQLVSSVSANYSADSPEAPRLARVDPKIIEAVREDARQLQKPTPLATPDSLVTPTVSPVPSPTSNPDLLLDLGGPYLGEEGTSITLQVQSNSSLLGFLPGSTTYRWDLNNNGQYDDGRGASTSVIFADEGEYQVGVQATDLLGRVYTANTLVSISNVPPVVDIGGDRSASEGEEVAFEATVDDPGQDVLLFEWDFGDGSVIETNTLHPAHIYRDQGNYQVRLRVTEGDTRPDS